MNFTDKVFEIRDSGSPIKNLRAIAYIADQGINILSDSCPTFVSWMTDRKKDYMKAHPKMVLNEIIIDHDHFTDFIVSGDWRK